MVSLSNGSLCDGNKRPLENGNCSSSSFPLKYKRRKVSAVRDFPPRCGENAPQITLKHEETVMSLVGDENFVGGEKSADGEVLKVDCVKNSEVRIESQSHEVAKIPVPSEMSESLDDLVLKVVATAELVNGVENLSANVKHMAIALPKDSEHTAPGLSRVSHELESHALVKSVGPPDNKTVLEIGAMVDGIVPLSGAKSCYPPDLPISDATITEDSASKNKYPWRRISATRDFPPFCGRNAPCPTEEQRLKIVLMNNDLDDTVKADLDSLGGGLLRETARGGVEDRPLQERMKDDVEHKPLKEAVGAGLEGEPLSGTLRVGMQDGPLRDGVEDRPLRETVKPGVEGWLLRKTMGTGLGELERDVQDGNAQKSQLKGTVPVQKNKIKGIVPDPRKKSPPILKKGNEDDGSLTGNMGKDIVVYSQGKSLKRKPSGGPVGLKCEIDHDRVIVQGLMAAPNCPWRRGKGASKNFPDAGLSVSKVKKHEFAGREKSKPVTRTTNYEADYSAAKFMKGKSMSAGKAGTLVVRDEDNSIDDEEQHKDSPAGQRAHYFDVSLPPFGPNSSSHGDARNKVRETLRLFQAICRKLLQGEESKLRQREGRLKQQGYQSKRIDLQAAEIIKVKKKEVNTGYQILGAVPGVEVGDEFQYRVELALVGIHRLLQAGIDYMKHGGVIVATSIVASGGYADDLDSADVLIYSGQGGNMKGNRQPEDQKLERGNLALKNSISAKNPVRVIRGFKETKVSNSSDARAKIVATYTYDGLYMVEKYWQEPGPHGKLVFKFELQRIPGQPELAWKEVKKSKKFKTREGLCLDDLSGGKELFPLCAVNTIDNEKPPPFTYITRMMYPDWYHTIPPKGCDCSGGCSDSQKCSCAVKNGGEIPYNHNGAIVEVKPLVYECGPSCKCPPSCYNRVSQHGIKIQLEIFKTESTGWGVRSLTSIPSGSFICEYTGELLEDKEAEQRTGNDEYLFDIGQNYHDCSLSDGPHLESISHEVVEDGGYTIDAAQHGNIGRFINHSCTPNLYAQNVIYDHDDKRMPHIMLFAAENIPPLQELTYHYNYSIDQIRDSNGNIKMKRCYCGSTECTGRMY